jgi:hypothetical protein
LGTILTSQQQQKYNVLPLIAMMSEFRNNESDDHGKSSNDNTNTTHQNLTLLERFRKAVRQQQQEEVDPGKVVDAITELQRDVARCALFSKDDYNLDDIPTSSLPLLALEHHLAMAYTQLPTPVSSVEMMHQRREHLQRACDLWASFLQKLEPFELLDKHEISQYRDLLELSEQQQECDTTTIDSRKLAPPPLDRDVKIARFRMKQQAEMEYQRLEALQERRRRLGMNPNEIMDGNDEEGLDRSFALTVLQIAKVDALEEWANTIRELPMIDMMIASRQGAKTNNQNNPQLEMRGSQTPQDPRKRSHNHHEPLRLTHITQNPATGQLDIRREEMRGRVFQPGWNQPTMRLDEWAEIEVRRAREREARQAAAEIQIRTQPRRYDQLVKDGMEDDQDLVDASAALDRKWDDFKDENPRGSGNKRGDVGDRNF